MATWLPYGVGPREDEIKGPARERRIGETRGRSGYDSFSPSEHDEWMREHRIRSIPCRVEERNGKMVVVRIQKDPCTIIPMPQAQQPRHMPQQTQGGFGRPRKTAP